MSTKKLKNWVPGPYNYLRHADNTKYFTGLSLTRNRREAHMFYWREKREKFGDVFAERKITLSWSVDSNMVKPEQYDHLHLVYHFPVPLKVSTVLEIYILPKHKYLMNPSISNEWIFLFGKEWCFILKISRCLCFSWIHKF